LTARQAWPQLKKRPTAAALTAASSSASSQTIIGSLPPSSSVTRLICSAAIAITLRPVSVAPVKPILRTAGCLIRASPTVPPGPVTTFSTPGGRPASRNSLITSMIVNGVVVAGFTTTVFPASSAGPILLPISETGKFHGTIEAHTPIGRFRIIP
jgi:hypothetical protein